MYGVLRTEYRIRYHCVRTVAGWLRQWRGELEGGMYYYCRQRGTLLRGERRFRSAVMARLTGTINNTYP
jgi:hypothetical protein